MGGEKLDAVLEPIAEVLILILVLVAVATVAIFIINKVAGKKRDRAHQKVSASRRTKHTQVDLLSGARAAKDTSGTINPRQRSGSGRSTIDILGSGRQSPDVSSTDGSESR